jgi:hypothetical protein
MLLLGLVRVGLPKKVKITDRRIKKDVISSDISLSPSYNLLRKRDDLSYL